MVWKYACGMDIILRLFLLLFSQVELSLFSGIICNNVNGQGYLVGATPPTVLYRFFRKFTGVFGHGLNICMWFGYNAQIIFVTFFASWTKPFSGIIYNKVNGQGIPCGRNVSYSFIPPTVFLPILSKLHWCFGHGLKICMVKIKMLRWFFFSFRSSWT